MITYAQEYSHDSYQMSREDFIEKFPNDSDLVAGYKRKCQELNCGCEQVIYDGVILNADVLDIITTDGLVDCNRQACTQKTSLGYTYDPSLIEKNCVIYQTPSGLIVPIPSTDIMSISNNPDVITGFFQRSKTKSWKEWLIASLIIIIVIACMIPPGRTRFLCMCATVSVIVIVTVWYSQYSKKYYQPR